MTMKTAAAAAQMSGTAHPEVEEDDEELDLSEFGWRVASLRGRNRWTREQLAKRLRVSRQRVANWEEGRNSPSIGMAARLSRTLKVTLDELVMGGVRDIGKLPREEWQNAARHLEEVTQFMTRHQPEPPLDGGEEEPA